METCLKAGFAQIFSCCPKNLSRPKFRGAAAPLAPPGPYAYGRPFPGLYTGYHCLANQLFVSANSPLANHDILLNVNYFIHNYHDCLHLKFDEKFN